MTENEVIIKMPEIDEIEIKVFQDFMKSAQEIRQNYKVTEKLVEEAEKLFSFYSIRSESMTEIWVFSEGIYVPYGKSTIREFCRIMCGEKYKQLIADEVIAKIEADKYVDSNVFFNQTQVDRIPVQNGLLNLHTKELEPFAPEYIFFNKIPVKYSADAKCPSIHKFFQDIAASEDDIKTFYELFGYCLYKDSFLEKAVMLLGNGRNGKTKFLTLLRKFLGEKNTTEIKLTRIENDKFAIHVMMNKLANLAGDISNKRIEDSSLFKELVGRDKVSTARKFKEDIEFVSYAKQIFATNNLPQTNDITDGFWTKWVMIHFPNKFVPETMYDATIRETKEEDKKHIKIMNPHIINEIVKPEEMSGLLNMALEGLDRLLKRKAFTSSKSTKEIEVMWIRESSSFAAFAYDSVEKRANYYITSEDILNAYSDYCDLYSLPVESPKDIARVMNSLFSSYKEVKRLNSMDTERMWTNVKFKKQSRTDSNNKKTIFVSRIDKTAEDEKDDCQKSLR